MGCSCAKKAHKYGQFPEIGHFHYFKDSSLGWFRWFQSFTSSHMKGMGLSSVGR